MEVKRQLDVLDRNLATRRYLCGDEYTIADIANYAWYGSLVLTNLSRRRSFWTWPRTRTLFAGRPGFMRDRRFSVVGGSTGPGALRTSSWLSGMTPATSVKTGQGQPLTC